jgi:shikimate dehydrogenase
MKRFGLIGQSLKHSFSPSYFTKKFLEQGLADHIYQAFEISDISDFPALLEKYPDLVGLNVTMPYKSVVIPFLDEKQELVEKLNACNCIKIINGKLKGFNTDVSGFMYSIQHHLKTYHTKALVLGTGGASKAVRQGLTELNISYLTVSRDAGKADLTYRDLDASIMNEFLLVINTTPLGMHPAVDSYPDLPYQLISSRHFFFDLVYNPVKTIFLTKAEERGATIRNGYEMLVIQAEESWKIWKT